MMTTMSTVPAMAIPLRRSNILHGTTAPALSIMLLLLLLLLSPIDTHGEEFQPYQINGGLVAAVAGKDFCVVAADTRMVSGYEILSRQHLSTRLWGIPHSDDEVFTDDCDDGVEEEEEEDKKKEERFTLHDGSDELLTSDGSVRVPSAATATTKRSTHPFNTDTSSSFLPKEAPTTAATAAVSSMLTFVATAGCAADCDGLKRAMRLDMVAHRRLSPSLTTSQVAQALSGTLYQRRTFPFYAFCVVAGIGQVFVYDAIGSYEQVAVATAGTSRQLLQPVLDRLFSQRSSSGDNNDKRSLEDSNEEQDEEGNDIEISDADSSGEYGNVGVIRKTVPTVVDCSPEEAVEFLRQGYRAVAEREISVGDSVVVCILQKTGGKTHCRVEQIRLRED